MINKKTLLILDLILVLGSLLFVSYIVGYSIPLVIAPIDSNGVVLFKFDNVDRILVDTDIGFISPKYYEVYDGSKLEFTPGKYYMKFEGSPGIREFEILDSVTFGIVSSEYGGYELVNYADYNLNVDIYDKGKFTGNIILERGLNE